MATVLWLTLVGGGVAAQAGSIRGRVVDQESRVPIAGATVQLSDLNTHTTTDRAGAFTLPGIPAGRHRIDVIAAGYAARVDTITVTESPAEAVTITLSPSPIALDPVRVEARVGATTAWLGARGVLLRRAAGRALLHQTRRDLRLQSGETVRDVLRLTPGVRVRRLVDGGGHVLLEPSPLPDGGECRVSVFLNGSEVEFGTVFWTGVLSTQHAQRPLRFDDLLLLEDVDAIELYGPEEMPVASDGCGALLLWSESIRGKVDELFVGSLRGAAIHTRTGRPVSGVRVRLMPSGITAVTDDNGRFELVDLVPGEYEIVAEAPGFAPWSGGITVRAYGVVTVELRM